MPKGLNNFGDFRNGNPVTLPKNFGNVVDWTPTPARFGNPVNEPKDFGNPVSEPKDFGNQIGGPPDQPTFDPPAGTYGVPQVVHIISNGADAIYYTKDGSTPTTDSTLYDGSVFVPSSMTLDAIAVRDGQTVESDLAPYIIVKGI